MTHTTVSARTMQSREHRTAAALHELADLIASGHIPEPTYSGQALTIDWSVPSAEAVRSIAGQMDRPVTVHNGYSATEIPFGDGSRDFPGIAFAAAVRLHVTHLAPAEAV